MTLAQAAVPVDSRSGPSRRFRRARAAVAAALMVAASLALQHSWSSPQTDDDLPCGPPVPKPGGGEWECTFADNFTGTTLDAGKWTAWDKVNWNTNSTECYFDDPRYLRVTGGYLTLTMAKLSQPYMCGGLNKVTTWGSGLVHTKDRFSQAYGRWEIRAKMAPGAGVDSALWLWPQKQTYPGHAEIDIAEDFGFAPGMPVSSIHWTDSGGQFATQTNRCAVADATTSFHTYTLEWTPTELSFFYDGASCLQATSWRPVGGYRFPAPFDQPFYTNLQLAGTQTGTTPVSMQIDYVRVWK